MEAVLSLVLSLLMPDLLLCNVEPLESVVLVLLAGLECDVSFLLLCIIYKPRTINAHLVKLHNVAMSMHVDVNRIDDVSKSFKM